MKPTKSCILTLFLLFAALAASAQADRKIEQQKRVIAALEQKIAAEERESSKLKEGRAAAGAAGELLGITVFEYLFAVSVFSAARDKAERNLTYGQNRRSHACQDWLSDYRVYLCDLS